MIVPKYFLAARSEGATKEALLALVEDFCLKVLRRKAEKEGLPIPATVSPHLVAITFDMYEHTLQFREKK